MYNAIRVFLSLLGELHKRQGVKDLLYRSNRYSDMDMGDPGMFCVIVIYSYELKFI